ncbi:MAG: hypothetical protein K5682_03750 [Lachnospiraceae bacterium]|nr:hypothetical protein [Lachnospiraceae bacterium]
MDWGYTDLITYMGMRKLPKGLEEAFSLYQKEHRPEHRQELMPHDVYEALLSPYDLLPDKKAYLDGALKAVEADERVLFFSRFFVWDMCSMRNKYDIDNYTELIPACLGKYNEAYAFLLLLACVPESEKEMIRRGIPRSYYEDIPHRMLRLQLPRYKETGRIDVEDMPWKMNFYTLTIFLLDRFLFIPYQHGERFRLFRHLDTGKVVGLAEAGAAYDAEGQLLSWGFPDEDEWRETPASPEERKTRDYTDGKPNGYYYSEREAFSGETFTTSLTEEEESITGYYMNPIGYTENKQVTLDKHHYRQVLKEGDWMIALHIPEGEGYTPERMQNSMKLALDFFATYYPELDMKGFWSSSWLYDERLRFLLGEGRNITNVQDIMFRYSDGEDGSMLYVHLYKDMKNPLEDRVCETSLQKKAREYLMAGKRFKTSGMMILPEEVYSGKSYYDQSDREDWEKLVEAGGLRL